LAHAGDLVFGATGTGIAALAPMIDEALDRPVERGRVTLYWGVREERDLFWQDEIDALVERSGGRMCAEILVSRPGPTWNGPTGRINPRIFDALGVLARPTFYLCGNGAMIRDVKAGLVERGVDRKRQIRVEAFFD
jgi:NAD(P)H-flavin reductase